ncbi:T9SS C-terminal target domain-containing protein [Kaistella palustris]|uniref:T9SS C-terminal target domain-containing protein n=1 Tax=Kaistella palustris TaxID=493376 RepID=UPI00040E8C14|nr:T9SS C-terminal target domain-containing protein [Kaistella palustris]
MKNLLSLVFALFFIAGYSQQYITVTSKTPDELVRDVFIGSNNASCITVSNITAKNWSDYDNYKPFSYGYFEKGSLPFAIEKGIILSTGGANHASGPNTTTLMDGVADWPGDTDLADAFGASVGSFVNATSLEFDFIAYNTTGISFDYMFLSEEYQSSGCNYSDSFAFLIKEVGETYYHNIALVPGTNTPVSSTTVRGEGPCSARNPEYFDRYNYPPYSSRQDSPTNFDGQTKVLTARTNIIPGQKYHIKLVIADNTNYSHDSAVFLKAGSFVGKKDLGPDLLLGANTSLCEGATKTLDATTTGGTDYRWFRNGNPIPGTDNNPKYTVDQEGVYEVTLDVGGCQLKGSITVEYGAIPLFSPNPYFCNYNEGNPISLNLQDLKSQIISNYKDYFQVRYYQYENDALAGNSNFLSEPFTYSSDTEVYIWVRSGSCPPEIESVHLLTPKKSLLLSDQAICPNATTTLKAETTFIYYKWMRENGDVIVEGPTNNMISGISTGKYKVQLTSANGCSLEQDVTISAATLPQITNIDVTGNTVTVNVAGGEPPYRITNSWNSEVLTGTNVFQNVPRGKHTVSVTDAQNCETVTKELLILNLINVITPNADGKNEVLDYSDLNIKKDVKIEIFDRFGNQVFISQKTPYTFDGKMNGRPLPTGTYWYILNWTEPDTNLPVSYKGWILIKNRN